MDNDSFWVSLAKSLISLFINKETEKNDVLKPTEVSISIPVDGPKEEKPVLQNSTIDWTDPLAQITPHFTVGEMIVLHAWDRLATDVEDGLTDQVKKNLVDLCQRMEKVRMALGCGLNVHCGFRSVKYNQEVLHSLPMDVHSFGMALDFDANEAMTIEQAKEKVRPLLEPLNMRLEGGTSSWLHMDTHAVGPSGREFKA